MFDTFILFLKMFGSLIMLLILFRIVGNKELSQSTPIDFVYMVLMISIAWDTSLEPKFNVLETFVLLIGVTLVYYLIDLLTSRSGTLEKIVVGKPKTLICNGIINEMLLEKERMSKEELMTKLRVKGIFDINEVEICYLEYSGELSVKKRSA